MRRAPVDDLLDLAEDALDRAEVESALRLCEQALQEDPEHAGAWYVRAEALRDQPDPVAAEQAYRRACQLAPDHAPSWAALGTVLIDLLRFDDAQVCVQRAIRLDATCAEAYWGRALLRERRADWRGAARDFHRAHHLDPHFTLPVPLDDATVEAVVEEVISLLHPTLRAYLENVPMLLEEVPDADLCASWEPPMPPSEILGYFSGATLGERAGMDAWSAMPPTIVLFRKNLERVAPDRERLLEELRVTVFHEVGHFLGLDEDDLTRRGLD
jgi:predicted Zn-dependent protease with MMP-like domain